MATKTHLEDKTRTNLAGGSVYVRIPPAFAKYIEIDDDNPQEINVGMAEGKFGKFVWIQNPKHFKDKK